MRDMQSIEETLKKKNTIKIENSNTEHIEYIYECVFWSVNGTHMYSLQDHYLSKTTATNGQSCGLEKSAWLEKLEPYSDFITSASESLMHKNPQDAT